MPRLGRLRVTTSSDGHVSVRTTNVSVFSVDWDVSDAICDNVKQAPMLTVDGDTVSVDLGDSNDTLLFVTDAGTAGFHRKSLWKVWNFLDACFSGLHGPVHRSSPALTG